MRHVSKHHGRWSGVTTTLRQAIIGTELTAYVSLAGEDRIVRLALDSVTGALRPTGSTPLSGGPAPMAFDPSRRHIYVSRRRSQQLSTLAVRPDGLDPVGEIPLTGGACFVATDQTGAFLLSAYYGEGGVTVHRIIDGVVVEPELQWVDTGSGAHSVGTDRSNRIAFSCNIAAPAGSNAVHQFSFDAASGRLTPNNPPRVIGYNGCGPRHFCFHPTLPVVYTSDEQGSSVTAFHLDTELGTLARWHTRSTLPPGYAGENTCAQIRVTPDGARLFAPNRGHDSVADFTLAPGTGELTLREVVRTEPTPRAFQIDPQGRLLLVAGLGSGAIDVFRILTGAGLERLDTTGIGESPMWILVAN